MIESGDACGVGFAAVSGDVVESTHYILNKGYNGHSPGCGGAGKSAREREAMVVQQYLEWWCLTFDLPLLRYNTPHRGVHRRFTSKHHPPSILHPTKLYYSSRIDGGRQADEVAAGESEGHPRPSGMLSI